jgi:poly(3-hydroxybutyrate) depolymerase
MKRPFSILPLLPLLAMTAGCPVTQPQQTPVPALRQEIKATGTKYWLYVPSYHRADRDWPLVITLHGTYGWDGPRRQIDEWKYLAEQRGLIVAAPDLQSAQGILPVVRSAWYKDLAADEKSILALIDELVARYRVDPHAVLLTGFSAGGYVMYDTGLRNPQRFDMLISRACNSDLELLERVELTDAARELPVMIFCGKDDLKKIQDQSWAAYRYLREHRCFQTRHMEIKGGHLRRPELAYRIWQERLPAKYRR